MRFADLREVEPGAMMQTDICIVGSGPAGLTVAAELATPQTRILIVEAGGFAPEAAPGVCDEIQSVGEPRIMDQRLVRDRAFGGTSHSWTGRCTPLDELDFAQRPWIEYSGWPIRRQGLASYLDRACRHLGLGPSQYEPANPLVSAAAPPAPGFDPAILQPCIWQYSRQSWFSWDYMRFAKAFRKRHLPNVSVLLHAVVSQIVTDAERSAVQSVEVTDPEGRRATIGCKMLVLCAGGIENARILLYSDRQQAGGVGNQNGMVGRFLMDHPRCTLAEFNPAVADDVRTAFGPFSSGPHRNRTFVHGLAMSPRLQEEHGLLNCAAWLTEDRADDDPWDAMKRLVARRGRGSAAEAWTILSQPRLISSGLASRVIAGRGLPHKLRRLVLDCIVEQQPDPESRLTLSTQRDRLGLPLARLDWRISERERRTVAMFGLKLQAEFLRLGLSQPELVPWIKAQQLADARFVDVCHPMGTTRMSQRPSDGVVDPDCRMHTVRNLFIAGSSVFPTAGHANPTLMIVALAIRLADTLKAELAA